jgi:hypothetical protein
MDRAIRKEIIRLWDAMLPMEQIYQMLPCKLQDAKRYVANLREDGTLEPRHRRERSMRLVKEAYNSGITDVDELAEMFSFTRYTIIQYLNMQGVHRPRPTKYSTTLSGKTSEIMQQIREAKLSQTQLAKKYGVSRQYIHYLSNKI